MKHQSLSNSNNTIDYSTLKGQILSIAKQSYHNAKNAWSGQECFSCYLMHDFFQNLNHVTCAEVTQIFRKKVNEHYEKEVKPRKRCINNDYCYNFGALQSNNEESTILSMIHNIINIMSQSAPTSNAEYQADQALLDLEYEINCLCSKCKESQSTQSDKVIKERYQSQHLECKSLKDCKYSSSQKVKMDCIADFLKEERKKICRTRQSNKHRNQSVFHLYGDLLNLDKHKYTEDCQCDQSDKSKEKLMSQLVKKNQHNQRQIKRFVRKLHLQRSQDQINRPIAQTTPSKAQQKTLQIKPLLTPPLINRQLNSTKIIKRTHTIKAKPIIDPITNVQQTLIKFTRMQKSVQNALMSCERQRQKGRSILKSIVINASDLFTEEKKEVVRPNVQKPYFKRLQRILKSSQQMIKCIGIRRRPSFQGMNNSQPLSINS